MVAGAQYEQRDVIDGADDPDQRLVLDQHVVDGRGAGPVLHIERRGRVALRVQVDDQHPRSVLGQRGGQVDRRRGLAHAALLVGDRDHPAGSRPGPGALPGAAGRGARGPAARPRRPAGLPRCGNYHLMPCRRRRPHSRPCVLPRSRVCPCSPSVPSGWSPAPAGHPCLPLALGTPAVVRPGPRPSRSGQRPPVRRPRLPGAVHVPRATGEAGSRPRPGHRCSRGPRPRPTRPQPLDQPQYRPGPPRRTRSQPGFIWPSQATLRKPPPRSSPCLPARSGPASGQRSAARLSRPDRPYRPRPALRPRLAYPAGAGPAEPRRPPRPRSRP